MYVWKILYYMNTYTAFTDTHTGLVCTGLPATFTCTCIGRTTMNVIKLLFVRTEPAERN